MKARILLSVLGFYLVAMIGGLTAQTVQLVQQDTTRQDTAGSEYARPSLVLVLEVDGAISIVADTRINDAVEIAEERGAELLVLKLNTPGGFVTNTWSICQAILNSRVPVCVYIAPSGARAGSAGVYITYSSHIAAMAPSTNIGAATPVSGGGQSMDSVMAHKVTNDAAAQIRAAAQRKGRNIEWAERAVREAASITDQEALDSNVVEFIAKNLDDLMEQLDGYEVEVDYRQRTLNLANPQVEVLEITLIDKFLKFISNPEVIVICFSLGSLALVIEFYNPGAILPGVVGAIMLIIAFWGASVLPVNYAGVAFLILAAILFVLEFKIASAGMLTIGGIICLILGAIMLIDTDIPELKVDMTFIIPVALFIGGVAFLAAWMVVRAHRGRITTGNEGLVGKIATVKANNMVYVDGALWHAESDSELEKGTRVEVVAINNLRLKVKKIDS